MLNNNQVYAGGDGSLFTPVNGLTFSSPGIEKVGDGVDQSVSSIQSIKKSEKENIEETVVPIMIPWINPTDYGDFLKNGSKILGSGLTIDAAKSVQGFQQGVSEICTKILGDWVKSISEMAARRREEENSPLHRLFQDFETRLEKGDSSAKANVATITAMLILGTTFSAGVPGTATINPINFYAIQEIVAQAAPLVAGNMGAELGLIASLFTTAAMYQATFATIVKGGCNGRSNPDVEFAKNYAAAIIQLVSKDGAVSGNGGVSGNQINQFVWALMIGKTTTNISTQRQDQLAALVKLVLLFNALVLLTKVEVSHEFELNPKELAAMINGGIVFKEGDPRIKLVALIQHQLEILDPEEATHVIAGLFAYYDKLPSTRSLTEPMHAFASIFEEGDTNLEKILRQPG